MNKPFLLFEISKLNLLVTLDNLDNYKYNNCNTYNYYCTN